VKIKRHAKGWRCKIAAKQWKRSSNTITGRNGSPDYKITRSELENLKRRQGDACAICRRVSPNGLRIDHDHQTGRIRGLLCHRCNIGLGCLGENPAVLERALQYLS